LYQVKGNYIYWLYEYSYNEFEALNEINTSMSTNFAELLIVSKEEILIEELEKTVSYDEK
jgi:hypothetical protein